MSKPVGLMLFSMVMALVCFGLVGYSFTEKIGDGSWNEGIFLCAVIGLWVFAALVFIALLWALIKK